MAANAAGVGVCAANHSRASAPRAGATRPAGAGVSAKVRLTTFVGRHGPARRIRVLPGKLQARMSRLNTFLSGVRVIDLSRHLPGPLATLLLADMGAEVIKIEPPGGDDLRTMGPCGPRGHSVYFDAVNAGKATRRMNLKDPDARAALLRLVETADVLVESFRPDVMARLELDYETVKPRNPALVYCSLSGFGAKGPLSHKPGHDLNYVSLAGALSTSAAGQPMLPESLLADNAGALFASLAIVGALYGRTRDQRGCHLDLALVDAVLPLRLFDVAALGVSGQPPAYGAGQLNGGAAYYQIYATS